MEGPLNTGTFVLSQFVVCLRSNTERGETQHQKAHASRELSEGEEVEVSIKRNRCFIAIDI